MFSPPEIKAQKPVVFVLLVLLLFHFVSLLCVRFVVFHETNLSRVAVEVKSSVIAMSYTYHK